MANTTPDQVRFKITASSSTTTYHDISQYLTDWAGFNHIANLQESHTFGDAWREQLYSGFNMADDITISGFFDDAATSGPHALLGLLTALGNERSIKMSFGTTNAYIKTDVLIRSYNRIPTRGELTRYSAVLAPTGTPTLVTT